MATLARYLPATRRQYSSFFSSKPGGGRYFNSAKPPKSVVPNGRSGTNPSNSSTTPKTTSQASAESSESLQDSTNLSGGNGSASNRSNQMRSTKGDEAPTSAAPPTTSNPLATKATPPMIQSNTHHASHPVVSAKDFKLHQFFSLHRPLLLLSDPPAIFQSAPSTGPLFTRNTPGPIAASDALNDPHSLLFTGQATSPDDTVDASIDADAEAARQLTRALTMSRAGSTIDWENTLKTLGLDVSMEKDRVDLKEQMDREWEDVLMDSTQRKRRKKMKKHK